jgi:four helix bundle protein
MRPKAEIEGAVTKRNFANGERPQTVPTARPHWRFEDLEIWQLARDLAVSFHRVAERLEQRKLFRYAEQVRGAGISMSNNIAEGSGSVHRAEFRQFLNISRRSTFENASMLLVFEAMRVLEPAEVDPLLDGCDKLSRMITNYTRTR